MFRADALRVVQIGHGARDLQDAIVRAGRQSHLANREFERPFARLIERAQFPQLLDGDVGIVEPSRPLNRASLRHTNAHLVRPFAAIVAAQFLIGNRGHFDVQVDSVEKRATDLTQVSLDNSTSAAAFARGVAKKSTGAPVQTATDTT